MAAIIRQGVGDAEGRRSFIRRRLGGEAKEGFNRALEGKGEGFRVIRGN